MPNFYDWVGGSGNFADPANWLDGASLIGPAGPPGPADSAYIAPYPGQKTPAGVVTAGALQVDAVLTIAAGAELDANSLLVDGPSATAVGFNHLVDGGVLRVSGSMTIDCNATFPAYVTVGGALVNGTVTYAVLDAADLVIGDAAGGLLSVADANATVSGNLIVGNQAGSKGTIQALGNDSLTIVGNTVIGNAGSGQAASAMFNASTVTLGAAATGLGVLNVVSGAAQTMAVGMLGFGRLGVSGNFNAGKMTVGGAAPNASNSLGQPNGTGGNWAYAGGTGILGVTGNGELTTSSTLTLHDFAQHVPGGTLTTQGSITFAPTAAIEVGGNGGAAAATMQIDPNALLVGHGLVDAAYSKTPSSAAPTALSGIVITPKFGTIVNNGTIEASQGLLVLNADETGDGNVLIDENSSLELGAQFGTQDDAGGIIDFQGFNNGTLILDDPMHFLGNITGLADGGDDPTLGSTIVLHNVGVPTGNPLAYATIADEAGAPVLEFHLAGTDQAVDIPIANTDYADVAHDFFRVSQQGNDTVLTYTAGNPEDLAVNGPQAREQYGVDGTGITVGVISNSFNADGNAAQDIAIDALPGDVNVLSDIADGNDEGRAMAQIVHAIAPGAVIDFASGYALTGQESTQQSIADAIASLVAAGCQVIVDDTGPFPEAAVGSPIEQALDQAVSDGVVYITAAGNDGLTLQSDPSPLAAPEPVYGHSADPLALSVAAMNLLATPNPPSTVGGYLPAHTEKFSSTGAVGITGPDGDPTTFGLESHNPFFGTSAAAPAVAGVAALVLGANPQLRNKPWLVDQVLQATAFPFGESATTMGAGLVQANAAVAAAMNFVVFDGDSVPNGPGPQVQSFYTAPGPGNVDANATIALVITLSTSVTVAGGVPTLLLNDGALAGYDAALSDPSSGRLVFVDTVGNSDATPDLEVNGISLNGASVLDINNNAADFSGAFHVPTGLTVNSPLEVAAVPKASTSAIASGQTVELGIVMNEAVSVNSAGGAPLLLLNNGGTATFNAVASNLSAGTLMFDYVPAAIDAAPDLAVTAIDLPSGSTVQDAAGNQADFSMAIGQSFGVQVNPAFVNLFTASASGVITTGQTIQLGFTMSQPVAVDTTGGTPTLTLNDGGVATYDPLASDAGTGLVVFDHTVQAAEQTPELEVTQFNANGAAVTDAHGATASFAGGLNYPTGISVNSPIAATSVASVQSGTLQAGDLVQLTLTLNQPVQLSSLDSLIGSLSLSLNDGGEASYDAGASTAMTLQFDHLVQSGETTPNLAIMQVNAAGVTPSDASGNRVNFAAVLNEPTGVSVVSCFVEGTHIATQRGDVPVERLRPDEQIRLAQRGGCEPMIWRGHRTIDCRRHPEPRKIWPVRVSANAFGEGLPRRDLWLSPDHAIAIDDILISVKHLINGTSIVQVPRKVVTYYHVELPRHGIILAEGLPTESYLDVGNRADFGNGGDVVTLHPDLPSWTWEAKACAPLVATGPELDAARRRVNGLAVRAHALRARRAPAHRPTWSPLRAGRRLLSKQR